MWAQAVGAVGMTAVRGLTLDSAGNVYAQGLQGQADFDPRAGTATPTSNGTTDVFVAKCSAAGTFAWAVSFGGAGADWSEGVAVDAAGNVYVAGQFASSVDFDPDPLSPYELTSTGASDIFLVKLRQS